MFLLGRGSPLSPCRPLAGCVCACVCSHTLASVCLRSSSASIWRSRLESVSSHLACWAHKSYRRAIPSRWPPPKITGLCVALFSSIRFKECARQILGPKVISFYWFSKLTRRGESWAKLKLSWSQAWDFYWVVNVFSPCENFTISFLRERLCLDAKKVAQSRSSRIHFIWQRLLV